MSYAENTSVPVEKSKAELDAMLARAGARQRMVGTDDDAGSAFVGFTIGEGPALRQVRLTIPLPKVAAFARKRFRGDMVTATPEEQHKAHEQACRSRWRAMVLLVKAKLEAVALGVSTLEREFLADIYLPSGETVHGALREKLSQAYLTGNMPPLLGAGGGETP